MNYKEELLQKINDKSFVVGIVGLGYVGCVSLGCLAKNGHHVIGVDTNNTKVDFIDQGKASIVETEIDEDDALLALDFKIDKIPDIDDGMKIQCTEIENPIYSIQKFGKQLRQYDAIDCGIFKFNHNFFSVLEESISKGKCSLSDACNILSQKKKMKGFNIKDNLWLDVDTPKILEYYKMISQIL